MDVHAESIASKIAEPDGEVRIMGTIPNREDSIRKLIRRVGPVEHLRACYEAGPTGFVLYWQLAPKALLMQSVEAMLRKAVESRLRMSTGSQWGILVYT